jgi:hypothetical protein
MTDESNKISGDQLWIDAFSKTLVNFHQTT